MHNSFLAYFVKLYMFPSYLAYHQELQPYVYNSWYLLFFLDYCLLSWLDWTTGKGKYGMKTNWCHYFIRILLDLYMFRTHRPIFRRVRTAVYTTIGSVSVPLCSRALYVQHTEHATRAVQILNQWLCEQLYELSWRWACGPETCRNPAIYE